MKNRIVISFLIIIAFFAMITSVNAARTKLVDSSDATILDYGTSADSKYAYSFRVNNNTIIGETNADSFPNLKFSKTVNKLVFIPKNNDGSGKTYAWIKDVGKYNGKQVDIKLTFYWKTTEVDSTPINPIIIVSLNRDTGLVDYMFKTLSFEVKHEIYSEGKPLNIDMSFVLGDIDANQYFGLKLNNGMLNSVQSVQGARSYYDTSSGYKWIYDEYRDFSDPSLGVDDVRQHSVRFELENTNSFNLIIGSDVDIYSYADKFVAPIVDSVNETTGELNVTAERVKEVMLENQALILSSDDIGAGLVTLEANAYGPYSQPRPTLFIRDVDNKLKTETVLKDLDNMVVYEAYAQVPSENREFYYTGYEMEIDIPDDVYVDSFAVKNESGENVTNYFDLEPDGNKYTFKVKDNVLADSKFYSDTYIFIINTSLTEDTTTTVIKDGGVSFDAISKLTVKRGNNKEVATTNKVITTAVLPDSSAGYGDSESEPNEFKITTEVVNGKIDGTVTVNKIGEDVTINYEADEGYIISKLIIDGKEIEINGYKTSYTFKNIDKDHSIKVVFEIENPKTGAFIGFGLFAILLIGFVAFNVYSKRKNKLYKI